MPVVSIQVIFALSSTFENLLSPAAMPRLERQIENALARRILAGEFAEDERIVVDYAKDGGYTFSKAKKQAKASA